MEGMRKLNQTSFPSTIVCALYFFTRPMSILFSARRTEEAAGEKEGTIYIRAPPLVRILHHCHGDWLPGNKIHNGAVTLVMAWPSVWKEKCAKTDGECVQVCLFMNNGARQEQ